VSGSVAGFAHFTLMLTAALREQFSRVRAFAFIDTCDEVTRLFRPGRRLATRSAGWPGKADLVAYDGHSDYGNALRVFVDRCPGRGRTEDVAARCSATRAPTTGSRARAAQGPGRPVAPRVLAQSEPRREWGSGDSMAHRYGEVIEMVECRNVAQLTDFVGRLLPV
jgi:uncharacterized protein with von Willebrand factor type A (vWA) domain